MDNNRTKNAKRNIIFGVFNKIVALGLPFVIRTIILWTLGADYLGLSSLFTSILQVLNMAELGFSSAIIFSLYKPMVENDEKKIRALLSLYRKIYKIIGFGILAVGIIIMPFVKYLIKEGYPQDINIYVLYFIYLINTVISYLFFAYKSVLLTVAQRQDVINNIDTILAIGKSVVQISILLLCKNYYLYIVWNPVFTFLYNIVIARITKKKFPQYYCEGNLEAEEVSNIVRQIKGLAVGKISLTARNSFDSIILAMFCGLIPLTIYGNYYYIFSAILGFVSVIVQALSAGVGNSIAVESVEKNYSDFKRINFYFSWLGSWFTICLVCLYQPFMYLWAGEDLSADFHTMILFCIYFYISQMGQARGVYATASGIWWEFRYLQIGEMFCNLGLNFALGYVWGMDGVLWATIITVFLFSIVGVGIQTFKYYFKRSSKEYFCVSAVYAFITIVVAVITLYVCNYFSESKIEHLICRGIISAIIPNVCFLLLTMLNKTHKKYLYELIRRLKIDLV